MKKDKFSRKQYMYNTIGEDAYWQVNKQLARELNNIEATVLLADLVSKEKYFFIRNELTEDGYFYNSQENIMRDTTFKHDKQRRLLKFLIDNGLIKTKIKKVGNGETVKHFQVLEEEVLRILHEGVEKTVNSGSGKIQLREVAECHTNKNKVNNNISKDILYSASDEAPVKRVRKLVDKNLPNKQICDNILTLIKNNYLNHFNVRKHKIDKPSKLINNIIKMINALMNGEFETYVFKNYNEFNKEFFNKYKINKLLTKKWSEAEIIQMFNNINLYMDQSYYPHHNNAQTKPGLDTLLFNSRTGTSIALWLFAVPPKKGNECVAAVYPEKIETRYKKIAFANYKFTEKENHLFKLALNSFYTTIEKKLTSFKSNHYNIKIPDSIYTVHARWIRDCVDATNFSACKIISAENGFWTNFNTYVQNTYNATLEPTDKKLKQCLDAWTREQKKKKRNEEHAERSRAEFIISHVL